MAKEGRSTLRGCVLAAIFALVAIVAVQAAALAAPGPPVPEPTALVLGAMRLLGVLGVRKRIG